MLPLLLLAPLAITPDDTVTGPELPAADVPELNTSTPLEPPEPVGLPDRTVTDPDDGPTPLLMYTAPPVNALLPLAVPELNVIEPPTPELLSRTTTLIAPLLPLVAAPLAMTMLPDTPDADAPVLSAIRPDDVP